MLNIVLTTVLPRCTINNVTLLADLTTDIDPAKWEAAVRNVVFREPNLRTDVVTSADYSANLC